MICEVCVVEGQQWDESLQGDFPPLHNHDAPNLFTYSRALPPLFVTALHPLT